MMTTTLNAIRAHDPCSDGWARLLRHLGKTQADDAPLPFSVILESNGLDDALWACRAAPQYNRQWRLFAVWCARQVQHLMQDPRSLAALDVAERHANGEASDAELAAAEAAAEAAAWAAAEAAAEAAERDAAWDAARAAAAAARGAAAAAACGASWDAARAASWDAARAAARAAQTKQFLAVVRAP